MELRGRIYYNEDGLSNSIRGMHLQTNIVSDIQENITNFGKVGYQRKVPVVSSFAEYLGVHGLSEVTDTKVGRLRQTKNPLDLALAKEGYFQYQTNEGVRQTRDGRFKLDKNGYILTLDNHKVLSNTGLPIKLSKNPQRLEDIKINQDGVISVLDAESGEVYQAGQLSVVSNKGSILKDVDVRQGFDEESNVSLHSEFFELIPLRRNFEANRQLYIMQNDQLSKVIQELGRTS